MTESYGILSTYPPTQCGLATFSSSLASALTAGTEPTHVGVVEVSERRHGAIEAEVVHQWLRGRPEGAAAAAAALDRHDIAIVQHEYGIFDGRDGDSVLDVLRAVTVPVVAVLHTVLASPTPHQRSVLEQVVASAAAVVVMTETAKRRLLDGYRVDPSKVELIAHGAPTEWGADPARRESRSSTLLTWGLLGPGKGIEWAVRALADLQDLVPPPRYVIAGETHPHVVEHEGEAYRNSLADLADDLGVGSSVHFDNRYLHRGDLHRLVTAADVVVLPYDSTDQVTSGVLIEAVIARRPIVATAFPHAVELLSAGAGTIVPQRDPAAIADAVRRILCVASVAPAMVAASERLAPDLTWAAVAERYRGLGRRLQLDVAGASA